MIRYLVFLLVCALGQIDLNEVVGIQTSCTNGGWIELYQQTAPITWTSSVIQACSVDSCSYEVSSDFLDLGNLQGYEDDGYAFLILWDNTYYIQWKQELNPLTVGANSDTDPLSGAFADFGTSASLEEYSELDFLGLSLSSDSGVLLDGRSSDGAWFSIAATVDIELTEGDTSAGIPGWKVSGADGSSYLAQQVNLYVWDPSCGEWGIPSESSTQIPTEFPSRTPTDTPTPVSTSSVSTSSDVDFIQILLGVVIGGFFVISCLLILYWRHMENSRRKEMRRQLEEVNEKLGGEVFPDVNGWGVGQLLDGNIGHLLDGNAYNTPGYNVSALNQMHNNYNAPLNIVSNPYVINQYTTSSPPYNPLTAYGHTVPYTSAGPYSHYPGSPPYNSEQQYAGTAYTQVEYLNDNTISRSTQVSPGHLSNESQIITNLRVSMDPNIQSSPRLPLQRATSSHSRSSHRRIGSPLRQEHQGRSHSKLSAYHAGISRLSSSVDMLLGHHMSQEDIVESSSSEMARTKRQKKIELQNLRQLEESESSLSSSTESAEQSSDFNSSLSSGKHIRTKNKLEKENEKMDLGEFEGLCEQYGILQAEDMTEGASNLPI